MSEHDFREALFRDTMQRLGRMGFGDAAGITKTHIIALAEEIEGYREKINRLEIHLAQVSAERDALREDGEYLSNRLPPLSAQVEDKVRHPAELEVEDLREAIIRHFKASYNIGPYPPGCL